MEGLRIKYIAENKIKIQIKVLFDFRVMPPTILLLILGNQRITMLILCFSM